MEIFREISVFAIVSLVGGTCLLLWGLDLMSASLSKAFGSSLRGALEKATQSNFVGVVIGTIITGITQSSTAVTVIMVSFVQSQLMTFERTIPIIFGANIGTTFTAQIIAFNVTKWALAIFVIGFLWELLAKRSKTKNLAGVVIGLGLLFLGLDIMTNSMTGFKDSEYFKSLILSLENVPYGILVGAVFTALIHSSGAAIGVIQGLAMQDLISLEAAFPFILGANIGTCITAVLAGLKSPAAAKRVAMAHVIFNILGAVIFAFFVPQFIKFLYIFSPANDIPRVIANAQTVYNLASVIIFYPFIKSLARFCEWLVPDDKNNAQRRKYFFSSVKDLQDTPDLLLVQSMDAIRSYKNVVKEMLWLSRDYFIRQEKSKLESFAKLREYQKEFRGEILDFLNETMKLRLSYKLVSQALDQVSLVNEIEHVAYKLEASLEVMQSRTPKFDEKFGDLEEYFKRIVKYFSKSCNAVLNNSPEDAKRIFDNLISLKGTEEQLRERSVDNLREDHPGYEEEKQNLWVLEFSRSVNATSKRICQIIIDQKIRYHREEGTASVIA